MLQVNVNEGRKLIKKGKIIAYLTEGVYGIGCDPFNKDAVFKILKIKKRPQSSGFILLISNIEQLYSLVDMSLIKESELLQLQQVWPGPVTFLFPKTKNIPGWINGDSNNIAIRMPEHKIASQLCKDIAIISTSANISGQTPLQNYDAIKDVFSNQIDAVVTGELGGADKPTTIINILTGEKLR